MRKKIEKPRPAATVTRLNFNDTHGNFKPQKGKYKAVLYGFPVKLRPRCMLCGDLLVQSESTLCGNCQHHINYRTAVEQYARRGL